MQELFIEFLFENEITVLPQPVVVRKVGKQMRLIDKFLLFQNRILWLIMHNSFCIKKKFPEIQINFLKQPETQISNKNNTHKTYMYFMPYTRKMHMFNTKHMHMCFVFINIKFIYICIMFGIFLKWFNLFFNLPRGYFRFSEISEDNVLKFLKFLNRITPAQTYKYILKLPPS